MRRNLDHQQFLKIVQEVDLAHILKKDTSYDGSWKKRGGVGAFMMMARKWDRIESMVARPPEGVSDYDIFGIMECEKSNADGTLLAEIQDLRHYLLLAEAELMNRRTPERRLVDVDSVILNTREAAEAFARVTEIPMPAPIIPRPEFYDVDSQLQLPTGTTRELWKRFEDSPDFGSVQTFAEILTAEGPVYICGGYVGVDTVKKCLHAAAKERHPDSNARGDEQKDRLLVFIGENCTRLWVEIGDMHAFVEKRDTTGVVPRKIITIATWNKLSAVGKSCFVPLETHAIVDRQWWSERELSEATRWPMTLSHSDHAMYPEWAREMYEPRDGVPSEWQLRVNLRERWGR